MSTGAWVALYVATCIAAVPPLARFVQWSRTTERNPEPEQSASVASAIMCAYAWPIFAALGLLYVVSRGLTPVIFRGRRTDDR